MNQSIRQGGKSWSLPFRNNFDYVLELAESQIKAGADVLDVNVGFPGVDDEKLLPETVIAIQSNFDIPLCLDSPNPKAIEAALKVAAGKCLINSVNGERIVNEFPYPGCEGVWCSNYRAVHG